jgi:hypothetical protein
VEGDISSKNGENLLEHGESTNWSATALANKGIRRLTNAAMIL